jgi:Putative transposase
LHGANQLKFFGEHAKLADAGAFRVWLAPLRPCEWVVYAKRPFAGPRAVLAYLSRYTHRVAISNSRLISMDERGVSFRWKDYRAKGKTRYKAMTLSPQEFMRRFLLHVLPGGFHRIRHYGLLANGGRKANLELARELLHVAPAQAPAGVNEQAVALPAAVAPTFVCRQCGRAMVILQTFMRGAAIRAPPSS